MKQRSSTGKFLAGNKCAVGRRDKRVPWQQLWTEGVTEADFRLIIGKVVNQAKKGNMRACFFVLQKCLGNRVEVSVPESSISPEELRIMIAERLTALEKRNT